MDAKLQRSSNSTIEQENCIKIRKGITKNNSKNTYHVSSSSKEVTQKMTY